LIVLSARTEEQLRVYANMMADYVDPPDKELLDKNNCQEESVLDDITGATAEITSVDAVDIEPDEELEGLGFDPIASTELSEWISRNYGIEVSPQELINRHTLRSIASYVGQMQSTHAKGASKKMSLNAPESINLRDVAYTTQIGREALDERLAVLVSDVNELGDKLRRFCASQDDVDGIYRGRVTADAAPWKTLLDGREGEAYMQAIMEGANLEKLAQLWVAGVDIDWSTLYENRDVRRVSIPTYPFARDRFWVPEEELMDSSDFASQGMEPDAEELSANTSVQESMHSDDTAKSSEMAQIRHAFTALDEFGTGLLMAAMQEMGVLRRENEVFQIKELADTLAIVPAHRQLWEALLDLLNKQGYVDKEAGRIGSTNLVVSVMNRNWELEKQQFLATYPELYAHVELLWTCMKAFPRVVRGEVSATEVMFPGSSMALVEGIYQGNSLADYLNGLVAETVRGIVEARLESVNQVRILEVGAGTGGTSAQIFEKLRDYAPHLKYIYTDISVGFLQYGKKRYGSENPYVEFKPLDIERELEEQGFEIDAYDIVIAANVLHATKEIGRSVNQVAKLLKRDGCLVLNETTEFSAFATLTFGLLEGWWLSQDSQVRLKGSPLLSVEGWERVLKEDEFKAVNVAGLLKPHERLGQNVLIALRNDVAQVLHVVKQQMSPPVSLPESVVQAQITLPVAVSGDSWEQAKSAIVEAMTEILEIDEAELNLDQPHSEFGVDSVLAVAIVDRINNILEVELKPTEFFNFSTIRKLADHLVKEHIEQSEPDSSTGFSPAMESNQSPGLGSPYNVRTERIDGSEVTEEKALKDLLQQLERGEISATELDRLIEFS
jgi:acyl carrier protein/SAM-dependent methyltransferase